MNYMSRPEIIGDYILDQKCTVREASKVFGISKSTVHLDVTKRLKKVNPKLYQKVREILLINLKERNIRGGLATKDKYLKLKEKND